MLQNGLKSQVGRKKDPLLLELKAKLPWRDNASDQLKRDRIWNSFDINGNGFLSLSEIQQGIQGVLHIPALLDKKLIVKQAYQSAKNKSNSIRKGSNDYIEKSEFRFLLMYLRQYYEYFIAFQTIDKNSDNRITFKEFSLATPIMQKWGIDMKNPEKQWKSADSDGKGMVLFDEFIEWAQSKSIEVDFEESEHEDSFKNESKFLFINQSRMDQTVENQKNDLLQNQNNNDQNPQISTLPSIESLIYIQTMPKTGQKQDFVAEERANEILPLHLTQERKLNQSDLSKLELFRQKSTRTTPGLNQRSSYDKSDRNSSVMVAQSAKNQSIQLKSNQIVAVTAMTTEMIDSAKSVVAEIKQNLHGQRGLIDVDLSQSEGLNSARAQNKLLQPVFGVKISNQNDLLSRNKEMRDNSDLSVPTVNANIQHAFKSQVGQFHPAVTKVENSDQQLNNYQKIQAPSQELLVQRAIVDSRSDYKLQKLLQPFEQQFDYQIGSRTILLQNSNDEPAAYNNSKFFGSPFLNQSPKLKSVSNSGDQNPYKYTQPNNQLYDQPIILKQERVSRFDEIIQQKLAAPIRQENVTQLLRTTNSDDKIGIKKLNNAPIKFASQNSNIQPSELSKATNPYKIQQTKRSVFDKPQVQSSGVVDIDLTADHLTNNQLQSVAPGLVQEVRVDSQLIKYKTDSKELQNNVSPAVSPIEATVIDSRLIKYKTDQTKKLLEVKREVIPAVNSEQMSLVEPVKVETNGQTTDKKIINQKNGADYLFRQHDYSKYEIRQKIENQFNQQRTEIKPSLQVQSPTRQRYKGYQNPVSPAVLSTGIETTQLSREMLSPRAESLIQKKRLSVQQPQMTNELVLPQILAGTQFGQQDWFLRGLQQKSKYLPDERQFSYRR